MGINFSNIIKKLFREDHNAINAIGISVNDISNRIEKSSLSDKKELEDIRYDIDFALEFSDVISNEEKEKLEELRSQLEIKLL
ncbi:hypothetical protein [Senegalia massiliensis]|uniref:hypothetical protein n=1 Tax=Senegalia massiliensis TaxID=1720316 RepID=UPI00103125D6|nr:hypothetical protein [Senegalia massiliensis]